VREALEAARPDIALTLLEGLPGLEATTLRARAYLQQGQAVESLRCIEAARVLAPDHPETISVEVETLASLDRLPAASECLEAGWKRAGRDPALERARGVLELRRQGRAQAALESLERARAEDPELPFLRWPLAQAHLLVGRERVGNAPAEALVHARAAQGLVPDLLDARELEAEARGGLMDFEGALEIYAQLEALGRDYGELRASLHQRCATRCLLERDRAGAARQYARARALGMDDATLGFGVEVLRQETEAALDRGIREAEAEDWEAAETEFGLALELDPSSLEARNHLAVAHFRREDYRAAALDWEALLAAVAPGEVVLPDPVVLNLARAWRLAGERGRARSALEHYLDREPEGRWAEGARELLEVLEAEDLAGVGDPGR